MSAGVEMLVPLDRAADAELFGAKAAALATAIAAGYRVPPGVVVAVSTDVDALRSALDGVSSRLGGSVAVRSSAIEEDTAHASYAGQYETVLGVEDDVALMAAVQQCRDSARSAAALSYAAHAHAERGGMAVLIQSMVRATQAGVAFSVDPVNGEDHVVIEAPAGVGEALLAGAVTGERWTVSGTARASGDPSGVLTSDQAEAIADLCRSLATDVGSPVDIEWAYEDGELYLLQVRPVTVVPIEPDVDVPEGQTFVREPRWDAPVDPLTFTSWLPLHGEAFTHTFARFGLPLATMDNRHLYGRVYTRTVPLMDRGKDGPTPPLPILKLIFRFMPPMRRRMKAARPWNGDAAIEQLIDDWERRGRRWTHDRTAELRKRDLATPTDAELADHYDEVLAHVLRVAEDHFDLAVGATFIPMGRLGMFVDEYLGWAMHETFTLVQGFSTSTVAHGDAVRALLDGLGPDGTDAVLADPASLTDHEAGRAYLDAWGHRVHGSLLQPTEAEQPALIAAHLRRHRTTTRTSADPTAPARQAEERARSALADDRLRARFDAALSLARRGRPLGDETEGTVLEALANIRFIALEAGPRLVAAGRLGEPDDVFFLEREELAAMLRDRSAPTPDITRRRGEFQWALANPAPDVIGPEPAAPLLPSVVPPAHRDSLGACLWAVAAAEPVPAADDGGEVVRGIPGSPGIAEGPVRIVRGPQDFDRIEAGDIVVCPITQASWSPVFDVIGGLVTEQGGPLSHPGTLAREYHLPCVLSVRDATTRLTDGMPVRVDGGAGTVTAID